MRVLATDDAPPPETLESGGMVCPARPFARGISGAAVALSSLVSCGLFVSFDDDKYARRSVRGEVVGLEGASVRLVVNGAASIDVGNGPFEIPTAAEVGNGYSVTVAADPPNHVCAVERGTGTTSIAGVSDVLVRCASTDTALTALSLEPGTLAPSFDPANPLADYEAGPIPLQILDEGPKTVVHLATRSASARASIDDLPVTPGAALALPRLTIPGGTLDVRVTSASGREAHTRIRYTIARTDYLKASNTDPGGYFGSALAFAGDVLAVGSLHESSGGKGVDGAQSPMNGSDSGAVYLFSRANGAWSQSVYIKASNARPTQTYIGGPAFGCAVALSGDTLVVGSSGETSGASGIDGNESDSSTLFAGAVYVFGRTATSWVQQAYVKASTTRASLRFGTSVAVDGDTMAVGAVGESSNATGIDGNEADTSAPGAGAVYVFTRTAGVWSQQAYIKASNTRAGAQFGMSVALEGDTLVVGSPSETSNARGIGGTEGNTSAANAGAVYVFGRTGTEWSQRAYVKASNTRAEARFGQVVTLSGDTIVVGAPGESSNATGVGGNEADTSAASAGAAYVFRRVGASWSQEAYVKASNTRLNTQFASSLALVGENLAVGASGETTPSGGIDPPMTGGSLDTIGAVYLFRRDGTTWTQRRFLKPPLPRGQTMFGTSVAIAGGSVAVGAVGDPSSATGVNGPMEDMGAALSGAVFVH